MSRERVERKIERMLCEKEPAEPLEGLLERLQADIPPLDKIGAAHLRAALDQRRVRRLPVLWLTAASAAFMMVGGSLAFRLWQGEPRLGREVDPVASAASPLADQAGAGGAPGATAPPPPAGSEADLPPQAPPPAPALASPVPASEMISGGVEGGVAGGIVGGEAGPPPSLQLLREEAAPPAGRDLEAPARDPWKTLAKEPGVLADRINVGGNESGQPSVLAPASPPPPPPSGPPPAQADERRASPVGRAAEEAKPEPQQAPMAASRGTNYAPRPPHRDLDARAEVAEPAEDDGALRAGAAAGIRFEAALLPWRRSTPQRAVIGRVAERAVPISPKKDAAKEKGERGRELFRLPPAERAESGPPFPALALRFEPTAVVRARWLGEEVWRLPGGWEGLAEREAAGRSSRLEVELRPGLQAEQVVAYVRFPKSVRPLRLVEMSRSWEGASWELQAGALRSELAAALADRGARLAEGERSALLERARSAEAARPEDPRAREIGDLLRRVENALGPP